MLAGLDRHHTIDCCFYEQRLPWCWTDDAAPWISQQLGLLLLHIAGMVLCIAQCCCWQCLLTVGGNLLPHSVTPLDVTTWHNAADSLGTFYTLQNVGHQHRRQQSYSGLQVSLLPVITQEFPAVCLMKIIDFSSIWYIRLSVWEIISCKCVRRHCATY